MRTENPANKRNGGVYMVFMHVIMSVCGNARKQTLTLKLPLTLTLTLTPLTHTQHSYHILYLVVEFRQANRRPHLAVANRRRRRHEIDEQQQVGREERAVFRTHQVDQVRAGEENGVFEACAVVMDGGGGEWARGERKNKIRRV